MADYAKATAKRNNVIWSRYTNHAAMRRYRPELAAEYMLHKICEDLGYSEKYLPFNEMEITTIMLMTNWTEDQVNDFLMKELTSSQREEEVYDEETRKEDKAAANRNRVIHFAYRYRSKNQKMFAKQMLQQIFDYLHSEEGGLLFNNMEITSMHLMTEWEEKKIRSFFKRLQKAQNRPTPTSSGSKRRQVSKSSDGGSSSGKVVVPIKKSNRNAKKRMIMKSGKDSDDSDEDSNEVQQVDEMEESDEDKVRRVQKPNRLLFNHDDDDDEEEAKANSDEENDEENKEEDDNDEDNGEDIEDKEDVEKKIVDLETDEEEEEREEDEMDEDDNKIVLARMQVEIDKMEREEPPKPGHVIFHAFDNWLRNEDYNGDGWEQAAKRMVTEIYTKLKNVENGLDFDAENLELMARMINTTPDEVTEKFKKRRERGDEEDEDSEEDKDDEDIENDEDDDSDEDNSGSAPVQRGSSNSNSSRIASLRSRRNFTSRNQNSTARNVQVKKGRAPSKYYNPNHQGPVKCKFSESCNYSREFSGKVGIQVFLTHAMRHNRLVQTAYFACNICKSRKTQFNSRKKLTDHWRQSHPRETMTGYKPQELNKRLNGLGKIFKKCYGDQLNWPSPDD